VALAAGLCGVLVVVAHEATRYCCYSFFSHRVVVRGLQCLFRSIGIASKRRRALGRKDRCHILLEQAAISASAA